MRCLIIGVDRFIGAEGNGQSRFVSCTYNIKYCIIMRKRLVSQECDTPTTRTDINVKKKWKTRETRARTRPVPAEASLHLMGLNVPNFSLVANPYAAGYFHRQLFVFFLKSASQISKSDNQELKPCLPAESLKVEKLLTSSSVSSLTPTPQRFHHTVLLCSTTSRPNISNTIID